ncbi:MAG: CoA ester lyase [Rhodospirillales bacterium]|jgi:citrate lyase subunit beta/citryl-CoA lyase|nr:CoA ester lyase [Rhodospirillales bacterium]MDP6806061.1 CoA ester lyase [Rhodospirillales bacterium]
MTADEVWVWRSLLYVPANVERYVAKAHTRGADAILLDLEDSVPADEKDRARDCAAAAAETLAKAGADVAVRINQPLRIAVRDLEAVVSPNVKALAIAKTDGAGHVRLLCETVAEIEAMRGMTPGHTRFIVMVETAAAFFRMREIAAADRRVAALVLSSEDFSLSCGMEPDADTLYVPKVHAVIAARAAGVAPLGFIDSVANLADRETFEAAVRRSRRLGFEGATCVHPDQVAVLNAAFAPSADEVAHATRIIAANQPAEAEGRASFQLEGRMIDIPVVLRAERLLHRHRALAERAARRSS